MTDPTPSDTGRPVPPDSTPLLLRRWPAILVTAVTLAVGVGQLLVSSHVSRSNQWLSGVLSNTGADTILLVPLLILSQLFAIRFARGQRIQEKRADELESALRDVRREIDGALGRINTDAVTRMTEATQRNYPIIDAVLRKPSAANIERALDSAVKEKVIVRDGPRVRMPNTELVTRWSSGGVGSLVGCAIEDATGRQLSKVEWHINALKADWFAAQLGTELKRLRRYPGDGNFKPGTLFLELHRLLRLGFDRMANTEGRRPLAPLVQLFGEQWALTTDAIVSTDSHDYYISLDSLGERDWLEHMRSIEWVRQDEFADALNTVVRIAPHYHFINGEFYRNRGY